MFEQVNSAIDQYMAKWQALVDGRKNKEFFERLQPKSVGWKTTDLAEFDRLFAQWRDACDQIHIGLVNDRWIATMHLKDNKLNKNIEILKLMQRRAGSTDAVGLDHIDFLDMEETNTKTVLAEENDLKWTEETNRFCQWVSIWFDQTEAKLRQGTVMDVVIKEMQVVNNIIRGEKFAIPIEGLDSYSAEVE